MKTGDFKGTCFCIPGAALGTVFSKLLSNVTDGGWSTNVTASFDSSSLTPTQLSQPLNIVFRSTQLGSSGLTSESLYDNIRVSTSAAPEPSRALLALAGLAGIALRRRR